MRVKIQIDKMIDEPEIVIKCNNDNLSIRRIQKLIIDYNNNDLVFYKKDIQYFLDITDILFFETNDNNIVAHTIDDIYIVKYKLYILEDKLPINFIRISKSTIVNINEIQSIVKNITGPGLINLKKTYKQVFVSRYYYSNLKNRLKEKK